MGADKEWFEIIMKQANGSLMTALENQIQADIGGTREESNRVANHILDILDIANENKEQEIRNKVIDEFAERLKSESYNGYATLEDYFEDTIESVEVEDIVRIAEQMKGEQNERLQ